MSEQPYVLDEAPSVKVMVRGSVPVDPSLKSEAKTVTSVKPLRSSSKERSRRETVGDANVGTKHWLKARARRALTRAWCETAKRTQGLS